MVLNRDEGYGAGKRRNVDTKSEANGITVLYASDFSRGLDGWTDHWTGNPARPLAPISRTSMMAWRGSHSLLLSTTEGAYSASAWGNNTLAFKRLALFQAKRFHHFSAYVAVGSGGFSGSWSQFELLLDQQKFDNSARSLYHLRCSIQAQPNYSRWELTNDAGSNVTIPSSTHIMLGDNENKWGFAYVRLTVDTQANSGLGGYYEAYINGNTFDLTGLGAGSAVQAIQGGTANNVDEFNGGSNIGFSLTRNTNTGGCQLFADGITYSTSDTWA